MGAGIDLIKSSKRGGFALKKLNASVDAHIVSASDPAINAGLEADTLINNMLGIQIRAGYRIVQDHGGLNGLNFGIGVGYNNIYADYGFSPTGDVGSISRITLSYKFGQGIKEEPFEKSVEKEEEEEREEVDIEESIGDMLEEDVKEETKEETTEEGMKEETEEETTEEGMKEETEEETTEEAPEGAAAEEIKEEVPEEGAAEEIKEEVPEEGDAPVEGLDK